MNQSTIGKLLLVTCISVATAAVSHAQGVHTAQLLSGGSSCLHVIRLIQIHGVNNSFDTAGSHLASPYSPFGAFVVPDAEIGDLEIVNVVQEPNADLACGPKFIVTIRNNSCRDVCSFHMTAVATLGRIFPGSPNATVCVDKICAGATEDVCVQLPVEALAMGNANGQVIGFQKLIVAIDAFDELAETNEANNLKALLCSEIPLLTETVVEETATTEVTETTVVDQSVASQASVSPAPATVQTEITQTVTPDVSQADDAAQSTDALRSAIRMMDTPSEEATATIASP